MGRWIELGKGHWFAGGREHQGGSGAVRDAVHDIATLQTSGVKLGDGPVTSSRPV